MRQIYQYLFRFHKLFHSLLRVCIEIQKMWELIVIIDIYSYDGYSAHLPLTCRGCPEWAFGLESPMKVDKSRIAQLYKVTQNWDTWPYLDNNGLIGEH